MGEEKTKLKLVTIEDIKSNPNLDLTERSKIYLRYPDLTPEVVEKMVLGQIMYDYNRFLKERTVISKRTDELLKSILNGHMLTRTEELEMTCNNPIELEEKIKVERLREHINQNRGITKKTFDRYCDELGIYGQLKSKLEVTYKANGYIIEPNEDGFKKLL